MKAKDEKIGLLKRSVKREQTVKSLISSFRIENIHISEREAAEIYHKVENRIKKLAL